MDFQYDTLRSAGQHGETAHRLALEVLEGLSGSPKRLPSRFIYDARGTELFQKITDLKEYYPTACEFEIFRNHREKIASYLLGAPFNLIELGAGDGRKTTVLLECFLKKGLDFQYTPIDISEYAMKTLRDSLERRLNGGPLKVRGLVAEYFEGLHWLLENESRRNLVLFLGSNIGNFSHAESERFLRHLWYSLNPDDYVLIGLDLKKDPKVLFPAYNDSEGITREFNLNLLDRLNHELGADFDRSKFTHQGHYNVELGAMESYLISTEDQTVTIKALDKAFELKAWEGIHTEYSYKYIPSDIQTLAQDTGYQVVENFFDSRRYFVDSIWKVKKV